MKDTRLSVCPAISPAARDEIKKFADQFSKILALLICGRNEQQSSGIQSLKPARFNNGIAVIQFCHDLPAALLVRL